MVDYLSLSIVVMHVIHLFYQWKSVKPCLRVRLCYFFFNYSIRGVINQKSKQTDSNRFFFLNVLFMERPKSQSHTWDKMPIKPEPCGLTQPPLLISPITMNQSISDPSNLPNLLWRFVAAARATIITGAAALTAQHLVVPPLVVFIGSGGVRAPSLFIMGDGSEPRIQEWEISPLKWNMELWFDWKGATVWVTSVNTHLPRGVLSLKLLPGSVLPGAEVRSRWLKRSAVTLIRRWLTLCWLVDFPGARSVF